MKIWWILLICLGIRLIGINQSLWLDEAISANVAKNFSYQEILTKFSPGDFHPPGYYLMLKTWGSIFGYSEISLRLTSVIFSLITIYVVYLLGGSAGAMLVGFNPLLVYYSQEVRMYSMVTMWLTLAIYFLIKEKYWLVGLFFGLAFGTFYGSVFLMVAVFIYLIVNKKYKPAGIVTIVPLIFLLIIWPLMSQQLQNSKVMLATVSGWSLVLGKVNLKNLLLIPMKFTSGRISFYPKIIYYVLAGGWSIFVFFKVLSAKFKVQSKIYSFLFWTTLAIGVVFSIFTPMFEYFRFLYLIPIMALAIGKNKLIAGGFLAWSLVYVLNPSFYREDWKSVVAELSKDQPVYMIKSFEDPVSYYNLDLRYKTYDLRIEPKENRITVIPYGEEIHGVNHVKLMEKQGYKMVDQKNYRGLVSESWSR
ncbi:glycosyltransferase family 39 protein [Candidatus Shapirobacteria bacterium]|nr:glycosyltransferase family 39 protein [Candidatus Shapirobacteria bacterium]